MFGALISSDAGDIHRTIKSLKDDKVRVRVVGLAAQVAICRELCRETNAGDECKPQSKTCGAKFQRHTA